MSISIRSITIAALFVANATQVQAEDYGRASLKDLKEVKLLVTVKDDTSVVLQDKIVASVRKALSELAPHLTINANAAKDTDLVDGDNIFAIFAVQVEVAKLLSDSKDPNKYLARIIVKASVNQQCETPPKSKNKPIRASTWGMIGVVLGQQNDTTVRVDTIIKTQLDQFTKDFLWANLPK